MSNKTIFGYWLRLRAYLRKRETPPKYADNAPPLRSELFSAEQMEQHGKTLAGSHQLSPGSTPDQLLGRLVDNEGVLLGVRNLLAEEVNRRIAPAGEWLLDNFYLVEEQIRTAKRHFPKDYSRELPRLLNGPSAGLPRVYDIALETISHGDGGVDSEGLSRFVAAYQTVTTLKLGELWALPIMLRLALIENLRRVGARIAADRIYRNRADYWADQMAEIAEKDPKSLILVIADMARSSPPMVSSFVAEFARRLQGQSPALALPLTWMEQRLSESRLTIEQLVQSEVRQQAADQVSISNSISSLRFLGATDWREFVERMSAVEQTLLEDPDGVYGRMDFSTRDRYRHVIEKAAKASMLSEGEVARKAIQLAHAGAAAKGLDDRAAHVGFYLIDKGLPQLERAAEMHLSGAEALQRMNRRFPLVFYLGTIVLITAVFTATLLAKTYAEGLQGWAVGLIGILSLIGASQLAVALENWIATLLAPPHPLPRMDFSHGIPPESRT
ncbi:MAG: cyclic beta 1-2 glucan synthetase, partial [Acidobacteria bacterium]|nr:cyclic beta 1-2 glucan synthetase [Acidobacteriota bacterium]